MKNNTYFEYTLLPKEKIMKNTLTILIGLVLFAGGLFQIQNDFYGFACCFLGGALVGCGVGNIVLGR